MIGAENSESARAAPMPEEPVPVVFAAVPGPRAAGVLAGPDRARLHPAGGGVIGRDVREGES
ncbi:hypothetical protein ATY41_11180 [Leifsonia xyli subsp. xyli]|uniref:Uncharacterized protein n=1 Tax=Leifsonia xyli subsp. xyli TaxID=59736 RepID=A0A1E2SK70_LEIXY|nr:hypothetical protein [Leifsonia xyli]ODA90153.1 hypothetical protein ATY41_11180 [Leifsonia xyli subsp. xyli]